MSIKLTDKQKMIYDDLSMPEKIAILLIQLGEEATALIFSHMDVDVITEISGYIATAKNIDKQVAGAILEEFYALMQSNQYMRSGGLEYAKEILYRTFGPEAAQKILDKLANIEKYDFTPNVEIPELVGFRLVETTEIYVPLADLIDKEKEIAKLEKDIEKTQKELDKVLGKLSNEAFLSKAPQAVVDKENAIKEELETKIAKFRESINLYK